MRMKLLRRGMLNSRSVEVDCPRRAEKKAAEPQGEVFLLPRPANWASTANRKKARFYDKHRIVIEETMAAKPGAPGFKALGITQATWKSLQERWGKPAKRKQKRQTEGRKPQTKGTELKTTAGTADRTVQLALTPAVRNHPLNSRLGNRAVWLY
jgi:hypothetical protein